MLEIYGAILLLPFAVGALIITGALLVEVYKRIFKRNK